VSGSLGARRSTRSAASAAIAAGDG
jgi:hypothetical protein